eukprot:Hpha_TRINITY_DN15844_c1_g7::TRINITY_DN15844_c1_g7_i1::g.187211::m.187211
MSFPNEDGPLDGDGEEYGKRNSRSRGRLSPTEQQDLRPERDADSIPCKRFPDLPEMKEDVFICGPISCVRGMQAGKMYLTKCFLLFDGIMPGAKLQVVPLDLVRSVKGEGKGITITLTQKTRQLDSEFVGALMLKAVRDDTKKLITCIESASKIFKRLPAEVVRPSQRWFDVCPQTASHDEHSSDGPDDAAASPSPAPSPSGRGAGGGEPTVPETFSGGGEAEAFGDLPYTEKGQPEGVIADYFTTPGGVREGKEGKLLEKETLTGATLGRLHQIMVGEKAFLDEYHKERGDESFTQPKWETAGGGWGGLRMTTGKVGTPLGTKTMYEAQRYAHLPGKFIYQTSSQVPDVTYGTTFRCELLMTFEQKGDSAVAVTIHCHILAYSRGFAFGMIKKHALAGLEPAGKQLLKIIKRKLRELGGLAVGGAAPATPPPEEVEPAAPPAAPAEGPSMGIPSVAALAIALLFGVLLGAAITWVSMPSTRASRADILNALGRAADPWRVQHPGEADFDELIDQVRIASAIVPRRILGDAVKAVNGSGADWCEAAAGASLLLQAALEMELVYFAGQRFFAAVLTTVLAVVLGGAGVHRILTA